jgi:nucleoside-diphosphate-sugar epimerase
VWLVTGASGFVGSHVLGELARTGTDAIGLYRNGGSRADPRARIVTRWDGPGLREAFAGIAGIIHSASVVHRPGAPADEYVRFNVEGTRALIEAARVSGVDRLVFVSSIKVHGDAPLGVIDETTPVAPDQPYSRTKAQAEQLVLEASDLRPAILRLCPVYGRGDKGNVRTIIRAVRRRRFFIPGDGNTRKSIVHVSSVAKAICAATAKDAQGVFVVADTHAPTVRELGNAVARILRRQRPIAIPTPLLRAAAAVAGGLAKAVGISTAVSAGLIDKAVTSTVCDPSRVERELGVTCHVDLEWALRDEIEWLRGARLL